MSAEPRRDFGRYRILGELGRGAMGSVFRARDGVLGRDVALKLLRAPAGAEGAPPPPGGTSRLLGEARAAAAINHPNAVSIYDLGEVDGTPYIAMELVEGRTLRTVIGDLSIATSVRIAWLLDIARALAAAHARGVIHRDIKPENIIVRYDGVLKVLDFGIAKRISPDAINTLDTFDTLLETKPGTLIGTPAYMAPEQVRGEPADAATDQFAWGVVAYELLAGERPWGANQQGLRAIAEMVSRDPAHLRTRNPVVPRSLADAVMCALERERHLRFASMNELLARIDAAAGAVPPPAEARPSHDVPTLVAPAVGEAATGAQSLAFAETARPAPAVSKSRRGAGLAVAVLVLGGAAGVVAALKGDSGSVSPEAGEEPARPAGEAPAAAPTSNELPATVVTQAARPPAAPPPIGALAVAPGAAPKTKPTAPASSQPVARFVGKHHPRLAAVVTTRAQASPQPAPAAAPPPNPPATPASTTAAAATAKPAAVSPLAPRPAPSPYEDPH